MTDERIKMMWYIICKGLLVIKGNESESEGVRWMNLEPLTQSGESQKEKNKYHILMHIYTEYRKVVLMNLVENGFMNPAREGEGGAS